MYAVIFRATIKELDDTYSEMAATMRQLALEKYGCLEFTAVSEDQQEIAVSYWNNLQQIKDWKQDLQHQAAQQLGQSRWYESYKVQVVEIVREYDFNLN